MNRLLTTDMEYSAYLPLWQAYYKLLQEKLESDGESPDKYACLEPLCQAHLGLETEHRKHAWVQFYLTALCCGATGLPDICSCDEVDLSQIALD